MIRNEAGLCCRISSIVGLWWQFKEPNGPKTNKGPSKTMLCPKSPVDGRPPPSSSVTAAHPAGPRGGVGWSRIGPSPLFIKAGPSFGTSWSAMELCCWSAFLAQGLCSSARDTHRHRLRVKLRGEEQGSAVRACLYLLTADVAV